jgi:hypothetical protein
MGLMLASSMQLPFDIDDIGDPIFSTDVEIPLDATRTQVTQVLASASYKPLVAEHVFPVPREIVTHNSSWHSDEHDTTSPRECAQQMVSPESGDRTENVDAFIESLVGAPNRPSFDLSESTPSLNELKKRRSDLTEKLYNKNRQSFTTENKELSKCTEQSRAAADAVWQVEDNSVLVDAARPPRRRKAVDEPGIPHRTNPKRAKVTRNSTDGTEATAEASSDNEKCSQASDIVSSPLMPKIAFGSVEVVRPHPASHITNIVATFSSAHFIPFSNSQLPRLSYRQSYSAGASVHSAVVREDKQQQQQQKQPESVNDWEGSVLGDDNVSMYSAAASGALLDTSKGSLNVPPSDEMMAAIVPTMAPSANRCVWLILLVLLVVSYLM